MTARPLVLAVVVAVAACTSSVEPVGRDSRTAGVTDPPASAAPSELRTRDDDLTALAEAYDAHHPAPPADLRARIGALRARAAAMTDDEFLVEMMRLTAGRERDGHTGVFPLAQPELRLWPLQLYSFDDGWRVIRATPPYRDLVGGRVTAIGGQPIADAAGRVSPLVSADNAASMRGRLPQYLIVPAILRGLGIDASLTIDGHRVVPRSVAAATYAEWSGAFDPLVCPRLSPPMEPDWHVATAAGSVVLRYRLVSSSSGDLSITDLAERVTRAVRRATPARVIIDVRDNPGGDNSTYAPLMSALRNISDGHPGSLRILMGRCTFSAATNFVKEALASTDAVTVGEAMGGSPNMWGDPRQVTLPASGTVVHVATRWWEVGGRDRRVMLRPDVQKPLRWRDHRRGVDAALAAALRGR